MLPQMNRHMHGNPPMRAALGRATDDPGSKPIESPEEAKEVVARLVDEWDVGSIRIYNSVREPVAATIFQAADGRVPMTGHLELTSSTFAMEHGIEAVVYIEGLSRPLDLMITDLTPRRTGLARDRGNAATRYWRAGDHAERPGRGPMGCRSRRQISASCW